MRNIKFVFLTILLFSSKVGYGPLIYRTHTVEMLTQVERNAAAHLREVFAFMGCVLQAEQLSLPAVVLHLFFAKGYRKDPEHDGQRS